MPIETYLSIGGRGFCHQYFYEETSTWILCGFRIVCAWCTSVTQKEMFVLFGRGFCEGPG